MSEYESSRVLCGDDITINIIYRKRRKITKCSNLSCPSWEVPWRRPSRRGSGTFRDQTWRWCRWTWGWSSPEPSSWCGSAETYAESAASSWVQCSNPDIERLIWSSVKYFSIWLYWLSWYLLLLQSREFRIANFLCEYFSTELSSADQISDSNIASLRANKQTSLTLIIRKSCLTSP